MVRPRLLATACTVLGLVLAGAAPASALATRYAAPDGTDQDPTCPQANPCGIRTAVENALAGDVEVASGTYVLDGPLTVPAGVILHGAEHPSRTVIAGNTGSALVQTGTGANLSFLRIIQNGPGTALVAGDHGMLDDLFVERTAGGSGGALVLLGDGSSLKDSVVWAHANADGLYGVRLLPFTSTPVTATVRNLTVWMAGSHSLAVAATGSCTAADCSTGGTATLSARNVIARTATAGLDAAGLSSASAQGQPTYAGNVDIGYSNYRHDHSYGDTPAAGNQSTAPAFADPAGGDFHERPTSATVDAGTSDALGSFDLDGYSRVIGPAPDIGAYERPLPGQATTDTANPVSATRATLNGTVDSSGRPGSAYFQFGTDTHYGLRTTSHTFGAADGPRATSGVASELTPDHVYHYRVVVVSENAVYRGADRTLRTSRACVVPNLSRLTLSQAKRSLGRARCALGHVSQPKTHSSHTLVVVAQRQRAGSILPVGSKIAVQIAPRR